jgi:hypothetical protein
MDYLKLNLHAYITLKLWFSKKKTPKLHIGYFEMTQHVNITFRETQKNVYL